MNLRRAFVHSLLFLSSLAFAQVPVAVSPQPQFQAFDQSGRPLAFGCVFTYTSQTLNPLATYSDFTGNIPNSNPIILSASGSANIWIQSGQDYTFVVKSTGGTNCSLGTTMYSVDGIGSGSPQTITPVPSSTTPTFTVIAQFQVFTMTLTANAVALPVSFVNVQAPALITFQLTQDGTGAHTFTWPSNVVGPVTIDPAAGHTTSQTFVWNGTTILPVGSGFNSSGNSLFPGSIISANTYTQTNTFSALQNFNAGLSGTFFQSQTAPSPAATGAVRYATTDTLCWRNNANSADVCLSKNSGDNFVIPTLIGSYGGLSTVRNGVAAEVAQADQTTQQTSAIIATNLFSPTANGIYRLDYEVLITQQATSSSMVGAVGLLCTDADTSSPSQTFGVSSTVNTTGQAVSGSLFCNAKASTNIQYSIQYASSGGTPMGYIYHLTLSKQ